MKQSGRSDRGEGNDADVGSYYKGINNWTVNDYDGQDKDKPKIAPKVLNQEEERDHHRMETGVWCGRERA